MPRRRVVAKREVLPDPKSAIRIFQIRNVLNDSGKKSVAERILTALWSRCSKKERQGSIEVFNLALTNVKPQVEVKSRRVGGANYQVPVEVRPSRRMALAMRWLKDFARKRGEKVYGIASGGRADRCFRGSWRAVKKREEVHRMAEANKAFSHFAF